MIFGTFPLVWTVVLCATVYLFIRLVQYWQAVRRLAKFIDQYPGEKKHWLWGNLHTYSPDDAGLKWVRDTAAKFPTSMYFWMGPTMAEIWLHHPDSLRNVFKSSEPKPMATGVYRFGRPWIGDGLLFSQGAKWSRNRRLLTPAFHFDVLKPYMAINNACADLLLTKMDEASKTGNTFDMFKHISQLTLDIILRCSMSYVTDVQTRGDTHQYIASVSRLVHLWIDRALSPWKYPDSIYRLLPSGREYRRHCDYVHSVSEAVIRTREKTLKEEGCPKGMKYLDFLDVLLQATDSDGKGLTFQEIRDEVDTFLFEGHDTTASGISWTLYSLAEHGQYQRQCQEEIDNIVEGRDSDEITWDDLNKLTFLSQCVKEALRLHSPVPFIGRELSKEMVIDGRTLPKGTSISLHIYTLHHNPLIWPDSMEFRPSRFDPANVEKMDSFAFAPFSAGPRNCIGQNFAMHEMKTVIARVLKRFTLTLVPNFKVKKLTDVVMRPQNGIPMKLQARER